MSRVAFALLIPAVGRDVRLEEVESETSQIHSEGTKEGENGVEHLKFGLLQLVPTYVLVSTPRGPSPARPARRGLPGAACPTRPARRGLPGRSPRAGRLRHAIPHARARIPSRGPDSLLLKCLFPLRVLAPRSSAPALRPRLFVIPGTPVRRYLLRFRYLFGSSLSNHTRA